MAGDLPTHSGNGSIQMSGNLTDRRTAGHPSRDVLSLRECDRSPRATTSEGRDTTARQQQTANGAMWLVKGAPNLMQRLSRLPSTPDVTLLDCRKPKPFPWPHTTPPLETRLTPDGVASTYRMHRVNQALGAVVSEEHLTCAAMHRTVPQVIFNGSQSK
jgi:hypothetical protein